MGCKTYLAFMYAVYYQGDSKIMALSYYHRAMKGGGYSNSFKYRGTFWNKIDPRAYLDPSIY